MTAEPSFTKVAMERFCPSTQLLAAVILGENDKPDAVKFALASGPLTWVNRLMGDVGSVADAFACIIVTRAMRRQKHFATETTEIHALLKYFLDAVYGTAAVSGIPVALSARIQRFLYLVCAKTVAAIPLTEKSTQMVYFQFKTACLLIGELVEATKVWLPVANWLDGWSRWHALAFVIELTPGNLLTMNSKELSDFRVQQFFENLFAQISHESPADAFVLPTNPCADDEETEDESESYEPHEAYEPLARGGGALHPAYDLGTSFGWVSRSRLYGHLYKRMTRAKSRHFPAMFKFAEFYRALGSSVRPPTTSRPATPTHSSTAPTPTTSPHETPSSSDTGMRHAKRQRYGVPPGGGRQLEF